MIICLLASCTCRLSCVGSKMHTCLCNQPCSQQCHRPEQAGSKVAPADTAHLLGEQASNCLETCPCPPENPLPHLQFYQGMSCKAGELCTKSCAAVCTAALMVQSAAASHLSPWQHTSESSQPIPRHSLVCLVTANWWRLCSVCQWR